MRHVLTMHYPALRQQPASRRQANISGAPTSPRPGVTLASSPNGKGIRTLAWRVGVSGLGIGADTIWPWNRYLQSQ